MDCCPLVNRIFRQLFASPAKDCLRRQARRQLDQRIRHHATQVQSRLYSSTTSRQALRRSDNDGSGRSNWQQRLDAFPKDMSKQLREFPKTTARELRHRSQTPRRVKMLTRDFIDDSLYNPNYGYFPKNATIFNSPHIYDFQSMKDSIDFNDQMNRSYVEFEDELDAIHKDDLRQLWHTPTELFRPYYGEAIARYLVTNYKMTLYPYHDLIIYEIGAGNGTLMRNILDYIRETDEEVYNRTKFKVIEISAALADMQNTNLRHSPYVNDHLQHVQVVNRSIFDWNEYVGSPCFFLALEVIDNFAHDCIRYDPETEQPMQGHVLIDENGEFFEYYEKTLDPLTARFLKIRQLASRVQPPLTPLTATPRWWRRLKDQLLPFTPNLSDAEYLPVHLMSFFDTLATYFPHHRLVLSDFTQLPTPVPGLNAPIVQTRHQRRNIQVTTPFVHQGYFDIFFPTDFALMEDMYRAITGKLTKVSSHGAFMEGWADLEATRTRDGQNVMLSWYDNCGVMTTV